MSRNTLLSGLIGLSLVLSYSSAGGADIAECSNPSGKTYFPNVGLVATKNSGWVDDAITGGVTKVVQNEKGEFDIVFVDSNRRFISTRGDGGLVSIFAKGRQSFGLMVLYRGKTAETYTFFITNSSKYEYLSTTSRAGDDVYIAKSTLMRGSCTFIDLSAIK